MKRWRCRRDLRHIGDLDTLKREYAKEKGMPLEEVGRTGAYLRCDVCGSSVQWLDRD